MLFKIVKLKWYTEQIIEKKIFHGTHKTSFQRPLHACLILMTQEVKML